MISTISASNTSIQLLPANSTRENFIITNESTTVLYLTFGSTSSQTLFSIKLDPSDFYESSHIVYTGIISGIWDGTPSGFARITEV